METENINQIHIETRKTARIATLGEAGPHIKKVWVVLHGYRQLAKNFVRKFKPLMDEESWIIAPEALSRFYVDGFTGKVGASWMTREDRLTEIEDQKFWLNTVMNHIEDSVDLASCKLYILGFSQGIATMWRWLASRELDADAVIFYAGKIPEEFTEEFDQRLQQSQLLFLYGTEDQFITKERAVNERKLLEEHLPTTEVMTFEGKHDIYPHALDMIKSALK
ncbi:MAG: phospholipase [Bacteroidota bacterium]